MIRQIYRIRTGDNGQGFSKMVAVWKIQVEHVAYLGVLCKKKNVKMTLYLNVPLHFS